MKKLISIISAVAMLGTLLVAPAHSAVGDKIIIQAEEMDSLTQNGNAVEFTQESLGSVADIPGYYATGADQPTRGETGDGVKIASWGTMAYAVTLRQNSHSGIKSLTYKVNVPADGKYSLAANASCWYAQYSFLNVTVNGVDLGRTPCLTVNNTNSGSMVAGENNYALTEDLMNLDLVKGENTITFNAVRDMHLDKFELTCTEEKSDAPVTDPSEIEFSVQAEETASYTMNGTSYDGTPTQEVAGVGHFPKYYASGADQPTCGETGDGVKIASWGTKVYAVTVRPSGKGLDSLTYAVDAPAGGIYALSMRVCSWNAAFTPALTLNGSVESNLVPIAPTAGSYSLTVGSDNFTSVSIGQLALKKGANTLTLTTPKDFYLDSLTFKAISITEETPEIEYFVDETAVDTISNGNLSVKVNHGAYTDATAIVGAIFDAERLVQASAASIDGESTNISFGAFSSESENLSFKYFVFSSLSNLTPATKDASSDTPTPTPAPVDPEPGELGGIVVQAENPTKATKNGTEVSDLTIATIGGSDYAKYYNNGISPNRGETGDGYAINQYAKAYALTLRPANGGLDSLTYTVNATEAGRYSLYLNVASWYASIIPGVSVNGAPATVYPILANISGYNLTENADNYKMVKVATLNLLVGANTVVLTTEAGKPFYIDALEFVKSDDSEPIKVEAEEFDNYVIADIYNSAEALFAANPGLGTYNAGGTGNGVVGNAYNKVYAMTFHKSGDTAGIAYYTVNIPKTGKYKVSACTSCGTDGNSLIIENGPVSSTIALSNTGSWGGNYSVANGDQLVELEAGEFEFTVYGGDCYADYFTFTLQK